MNSFIKWIGGKKNLKNKIIQEFPADIERYIEVFGGAGWVLFDRQRYAEIEVFNDINGDLINLYRCVKYHASAVQEELSYIANSRELFFDYAEQMNVRGFTDVQRAARYFILINCSFGANRKSFSTGRGIDLAKKLESLSEIQERLKRVTIENRDFENLIKIYDREKALFYCDPPYYKAESYYDVDFGYEDHIRLFKALSCIKGRFVLSYNADNFIEDLYKDFDIIHVTRQNQLKTNNPEYREVIIKNF